MINYNVIVVYDITEKKLLMCLRAKEPYKGKLNLVGGRIEPGETGEEAAYRELYEETGISRDKIRLAHVMDLTYYMTDLSMEVWSGKLMTDVSHVALKEEINHLLWVDRSESFCDMERFAGECNIEHILQHVDMDRDRTLLAADKLTADAFTADTLTSNTFTADT